MTQPNAVASFFTGGGKGITWPDQPPKTISGTITMVHPPEPVMDPKTQMPTDKQQIRIELSTNERNPEIEFDDGGRTLYVKSYMRSAIGDALKKVGEREPKIGGTLTVTFTHLEPPDRPGLSPSKHFDCVYQPPAVTGDFFGAGQNGAQQAAPQQQYAQGGYVAPPQQQPQYAQQPQQYAAAPPPPPQPVQQPVPQQPVQQQMPVPQQAPVQAGFAQGPAATPGVAKPDGFSQEAWDAMPEESRRTVAAAMGTPPY